MPVLPNVALQRHPLNGVAFKMQAHRLGVDTGDVEAQHILRGGGQ
jgi:hypothetical protein